MSDGLSQSFITALLKTADGFIWVGTQVGLDRLAGEDIRHFRSQRNNPKCLLGAYVHTLYEDQAGYLWVGTDKGPCRYNAKTEQFQRIEAEKEDGWDAIRQASVHTFVEDSDGRLFINTSEGFFQFDTTRFDFHIDQSSSLAKTADLNASVGLAHFSGDNQILLGGEHGPIRYDIKRDSLYPLRVPEAIKHSWLKIIELPDHIQLVGTTRGLIRFKNIENDSLIEYDYFIPGDEDDGASRHTGDLIYDGEHGFFLGSNAGMKHYIWPTETEEPILVSSYQHDENRASSLASDQVQCLLQADLDWLWVGTRHGISRLFVGTSPVSAYSLDAAGTPFCSDDIKGMALSPSGRYLILGGNSGLNIMDIETGEVSCFDQEAFPQLRNNYIINVEPGPEYDTYWLCFRRGGADILSGVETRQLKIEPGLFKEPGTSGTGTYQIIQSRDNRSWIASGRGLYARNNDTEQLTRFTAQPDSAYGLPHEYQFSVIEDHLGRIWTGTARAGLARLENESEQRFTVWKPSSNNPQSLAHGTILNLFEDSRGRVWCSTPGGISVVWPDDRINTYTSADGIPSDLVFGVLEDEHGNIWINSTGGLTKVSLSEYDAPLEIIENFNTSDRLTGGRAQYGWMIMPDGRMALAGDGLNIFHPDSLSTKTDHTLLRFTALQIFNQPVSVSDTPNALLPSSLEYISELVLGPDQNFPGFDFSPMSVHPRPPKNFSYRLLGLQDEWVSTQGRRWVGFPQLSPGRYTLQIRTGEPEDEVIGPISSLQIYQKAHWYKRWWAYIMYTMVAIAIGFAWLKNQHKRQRQLIELREAEREAFRQRSARDFHDEAGNYLTRIGLLSEIARQKSQDRSELKNILGKLDTNVQNLREGMRDFIWVIDPTNDDA